jgi:hypothetical protein
MSFMYAAPPGLQVRIVLFSGSSPNHYKALDVHDAQLQPFTSSLSTYLLP